MNNSVSSPVSGLAMSNVDYKKREEVLNKPWGEASIEEKLEKVRAELLEFSNISWSLNTLREDMYKLKEHHHVGDKIVIALNGSALNNSLGGSYPTTSRRNNLA